MKSAALVTLLCLMSTSFAQDTQGKSGLTKKPHASSQSTGGSVTASEAAATMNRVGGLFKTVLHVTAPVEKVSGSGARSVTRAEVLESFLKFYKAAEPAYVITPKAVFVDVPRLHADTPSVMPTLQKLISKGLVAGYGPLATGKTTTLTVGQYGDAVGYFLSRIVEMTHTPAVKWTPYLHDEG